MTGGAIYPFYDILYVGEERWESCSSEAQDRLLLACQ
jgi:hypothetical protein